MRSDGIEIKSKPRTLCGSCLAGALWRTSSDEIEQRLHVNARVSTGREIGQNVVFALSTKALNFKAWPRQCLYALIADINPDSVSLPDNETQHEDE